MCCVYMVKQKSGENKLFWRQQHWPTVIAYTWLAFYVFRSAIFSTAWPFFCSVLFASSEISLSRFIFFSLLLFWRAFFLFRRRQRKVKKKYIAECLLLFGDAECLHCTKCVWPLVKEKKTKRNKKNAEMQEPNEKSAKWVWLREIWLKN